MPIIGATISGASIDDTKKIVTVDGTNFGEVEYAVSDIKLSKNGGAYTSVDSIDTWGNLQVIGSYTLALSAGGYTVQVITSNNETITSSVNIITIAGGGMILKWEDDREE